jgi:hypothetical protein
MPKGCYAVDIWLNVSLGNRLAKAYHEINVILGYLSPKLILLHTLSFGQWSALWFVSLLYMFSNCLCCSLERRDWKLSCSAPRAGGKVGASPLTCSPIKITEKAHQRI